MGDQDYIDRVFEGKVKDFKKVTKGGLQFSIQHPTVIKKSHLDALLKRFEDVTMQNDGSPVMLVTVMREVDTALMESHAAMYQDKTKRYSAQTTALDTNLSVGVFNMKMHLPCENVEVNKIYDISERGGYEVPVFITPNERVSVHDVVKLQSLLSAAHSHFRFEIAIRDNEHVKPQLCVVGYFGNKRVGRPSSSSSKR